MAGEINEYTNTATDILTGSYFDIDQLISTGPNVWQSQKVPAALLKAFMLSENIEQILLADMQSKATAGELVSLKTYLIDDGSTLYKVMAAGGVTNQIYQFAIDVTTGVFGTFNLTSGIFTPLLAPFSLISTAPTMASDATKSYNVGYKVLASDTGFTWVCTDNTIGAAVWEIDETATVKFKKELTDLETYNGGFYDIDELPAVSGYAWDIVSANALVKDLTVLHVGNKATYLVPESSSFYQQNDSLGEMLTSYGNGIYKLTVSTILQNLEVNKKMQLRIKAASSSGDGNLTVYGIARLVKI